MTERVEKISELIELLNSNRFLTCNRCKEYKAWGMTISGLFLECKMCGTPNSSQNAMSMIKAALGEVKIPQTRCNAEDANPNNMLELDDDSVNNMLKVAGYNYIDIMRTMRWLENLTKEIEGVKERLSILEKDAINNSNPTITAVVSGRIVGGKIEKDDI